MSRPARCNKCTQETREPHFLKCDHFFCYRCVVTLYNEHVIEQKMQTEKQGPTHFPCGVPGCKVMTAVPLGGLRNLPRSCQMTGAMADLSLGSVRAASADVKQFHGATLKWKKEGYEEILSVAVMGDGTCLLTSGAGKTLNPNGTTVFSSFKLQRYSLQGEAVDLPFPCFPTSPQVVSSNQMSTTVVLVDHQDAGDQVSVYKNHSGHWECQSFTSRRTIVAMAVTQDDSVVCIALSDLQQTLVMFSITGQEDWTWSLPEGSSTTFISVNKHLIFTSSMNSGTVSVISRQGELLRTLPTEFICKPLGVTSDLSDRVVIADGANKTISVFTPEGHFIQSLLKCQQIPVSISMPKDRFLLVAEYNQDEGSFELCLYELH